jgi:HAD superfamily hydrolase (TIGR01509 family)
VTPQVIAVLFDWRGTLAVVRTEEDWVGEALRRTGGDSSSPGVDEVLQRLERAMAAEDVREIWPRLDCSVELHRIGYDRLFAAASIDGALAEALYAIESDPAFDPFAVDAAQTLRALHDAGRRIAVVSDIHFDIRPVFDAAGLLETVDAFVLSFELGVQKPDPTMFRRALEELDVEPAHALMVGDRPAHDGAAREVGISTILVPPLYDVSDARLHVVLAACGLGAP